ncbi:MAG: segregation and condensation protein A [Armatimonadota bacterium]
MPSVITAQSDYTIKLPAFEGPLDLLLHLIKEHKVDIYDIPIVEVTSQYLEYLSLMESMDLNIAGEFFVVAATLLEIKSRLLLPVLPSEEENEDTIDPRAELIEKLLEYERYKNASESLLQLEEVRKKMFWRVTDELDDYDAPIIPLELHAIDLLFALQRMLAEAGDDQEEITSIEKQKISLKMRMREVMSRIKHAGETGTSFTSLFDDMIVFTRIEIVMTFLALLELLRLRKIKIRQKKPLSEIQIWATPDE